MCGRTARRWSTGMCGINDSSCVGTIFNVVAYFYQDITAYAFPRGSMGTINLAYFTHD